MRLILVRHTRPAVPENVCYGATDLDVASMFEEEAARVIEALPPPERLVTSPLRRCRLLAERISAARVLVPVIDARLRRDGLRRMGGRIVGSIPRAELDAWAADFLHARPHGGESVHMLRERAGAAVDDYRRNCLSHVSGPTRGSSKAVRVRRGEPEGWRSSVGFGGRCACRRLASGESGRRMSAPPYHSATYSGIDVADHHRWLR